MLNLFKSLFSRKQVTPEIQTDIASNKAAELDKPPVPFVYITDSSSEEKKKDKKKKKKNKDVTAAAESAGTSARNIERENTTAAPTQNNEVIDDSELLDPEGELTVSQKKNISKSHMTILRDYHAVNSSVPPPSIGQAQIDMLNNAKAYFVEKNWEFAIDKLTAIIERYPEWSDPWVYLMDCYFELKDWDRCRQLAEELAHHHPDNVSAPCYQATSLKELNRTKEAIFVCGQAIELFPSSYFLYTIKGDCYFKEEKFKLATENYNRALKIERFIEGTQKSDAKGVLAWKRLKWRAPIS